MKSIFAGLIVLAACPSVFACPDFSGTYECKSDEYSMLINIKQTEIPGGTTYHVLSVSPDLRSVVEIIADGAEHRDNRGASDFVYKATCSAEALTTVFKNVDDDSPHLTETTEKWYLSKSKAIVFESKVIHTGPGSAVKTDEDTLECSRK